MSAKAKRQIFHAADARLTFKEIVKKFADGKEGPVTTLMGYPILWNEISSDRGGYSVRIPPAAAINFAANTFALFHHDFAAILGCTANDTLRIGKPDATGIPVEIDLPNTSYGRDTAELVKGGYCKGMSFSMVNGFEKYSESKSGDQTIVDVSQFTVDDVTITPIPAFGKTTIAPKEDDDEEDDGDKMSEAAAGIRIGNAAKLNQLRLEFFRRRI